MRLICLVLAYIQTNVHATANFSSTLVQLRRCTPASTNAPCLEYERCKATYRCSRADEEYNIVTATLQSFGQQFAEGNRTQIPLMNDFEDWKTGMHKWRINSGSLELERGNLIFDTTSARLYGDANLQGVITQTPMNTTVAGSQVNVQLKVLLSRSSVVIDTKLSAPPGMLGGFPGGGYTSNHNCNGPGSPNTRVYLHALTTSATYAPTIQQIQTTAAGGQTIRGSFVLQLRNLNTSEIPFDASTAEMKRIIENTLSPVHVGIVNVEKIGQDVAGVGRIWRITFLTAAGQVPLLTPLSLLTGLNSTVKTTIITAGNQLSGTFQLRFLGQLSPPISYNILPKDFEKLLVSAFNITVASVSRSDALNQCTQGGYSGATNSQWLLPDTAQPVNLLCGSAPTAVRGYTWKIQITTPLGNVVPTSPSAYVVDEPLDNFVAVTSNAQGPTLLGQGATVSITRELGVSFCPGGAGGAFGSFGGSGYSSPFIPQPYLDATIPDLLGGSGGGGGGIGPVDILPHPRPILGGAGGGAIAICATNDITIGPYGVISVNGAPGEDGIFPGGGGSGGSLVLSSGTSIHILGIVQAKGGLGGYSTRYPSGGGFGGGGRISILAHAYTLSPVGSVQSPGTLNLNIQTQLQVTLDPFRGAAQTTKSLYLAKYTVDQNPRMEGPAYSFPPSQPTRISYFMMVGKTKEGTLANNQGAVIGTVGAGDPNTFVWAIGVVQGKFTFGCGLPDFAMPLQTLYSEPVLPFQWYQFDVFLNWASQVLAIRLNGITLVDNIPFAAGKLSSIGLYTYDAMQTWWDEIYVGKDDTMQFQCPLMNKTTGQMTISPRTRPLWNSNVIGPPTQFKNRTQHQSHVSRRAIYAYNNGGLVPNDGPMHRSYFNDVRETTTYDGQGATLISIGELMQVPIPMDTTMVNPLISNPQVLPQSIVLLPNNTQYWFSEIQITVNISNKLVATGGIGACSTNDGGITWRNEGIMLHYYNLTDPFGNTLQQGLLAIRPKVIINPSTAQFVMWMHVDTNANLMGLSGVAVASYVNGPYAFVRSFYPTGATEAPGGQAIIETHDQTIFTTDPKTAYLVQSYYKTVEYWQPRPVMDPLWESVKFQNGSINYGLNYHRAFFEEAYDNVDDIYLQRFRSEDVNWTISCCNRTTNICTTSPSIVTDNRYCPPQYRKQVDGQGQYNRPIQSRYKDPNDPNNLYFKANSVPSHTDWGFQVYNIKTWRGTYFDALSTNMTWLIFKTFAGMASTYNIPASLEVPYPLPQERAPYINTTDPPNILEFILDTLGVPLSKAINDKYDDFDMALIDSNGDNKITLDEIAYLQSTGKNALSAAIYESFMADFELLQLQQYALMNPNNDNMVTYTEFANWLGNDPAIMFDQFDMDKSGYLDENELSRFLIDRQLPRLDLISILLDPDFDGRVYYKMFESFVLNATTVIFTQYDFDQNNSLNASELALLQADIGITFVNTSVLNQLVNSSTGLLTFDTYQRWMSTTTSLLHDRTQKIDNAILSTRPDQMTGPQHVVEQRRAKYLSITKLSKDFLSTKEIITELEGDFDGEGSLQDIAQFYIPITQSEDLNSAIPNTIPLRQYLAPVNFGHVASYWNGYQWELRPSAPVSFTYGTECTTLTPTNNADCLPCASQSPYITTITQQYLNQMPTLSQCANDKALDAFQQVAQFTDAGIQPHYSPCFNQSESVPCDVAMNFEGNVADKTMGSLWTLAWDSNLRNTGTSMKIRASPMQQTTFGQSYQERYPNRFRMPPNTTYINSTNLPDQYTNILGGG
uniref:Secreted protein n=1 Tax=Thraustotheca clavata TaxID=74557 RepID=A0A0A7CMI2_9STRA|nr:secreted protein [Thraustotheca clavata]